MADKFIFWEIHEVRKGLWAFVFLDCVSLDADWPGRQTPVTWTAWTRRWIIDWEPPESSSDRRTSAMTRETTDSQDEQLSFIWADSFHNVQQDRYSIQRGDTNDVIYSVSRGPCDVIRFSKWSKPALQFSFILKPLSPKDFDFNSPNLSYGKYMSCVERIES